ncbi:MAG: TIGR02300 family protein [Azospirillaceae bacterium]|nr:TIGR02300 family protein [Azospirillaceae bacterium]
MAKAEWGTKRICPNCGARYYDLRKDPPVCPSCGTAFDPEALLKSRRTRPSAAEEVKKAPVVRDDEEVETELEGAAEIDEAAAPDLAAGAEEVVQDDEEDVLLEDASELGEDDDMDEVVDVDDPEEDER